MNPEKFIVSKYPDLPGSKPVERAVQKEIRQGEKGPSTKEERIEAYLDRLENFFKDPEKFEHLKYQILQKYTTRFEEIPESYWKSQEEEMRKRGEGGDWLRASPEQKLEVRQKHAEAVLADQRASLEQWLDYFSLPDSNYIPKEIKYWIFRNVANLKELVKIETQKLDGTKEERIEFPKRSKGTVSPFPDLNQEALSYIIDAIVKKLKDQQIEFGYDIQPQEQEEFRKFLNKEDFAKLYAWANEHMSPIPKHLLPITEGQWVKYSQGSDPKQLVETIRGRGTGWCTAGENTAKTQLETGDFYVYYSLDDDGEPTMPRIAIRMEGSNKIAENPRGIAYKQNLDPYMGPVLENKLQEFGQIGEKYEKQSHDMKKMTEIENKTKANQELTKEELVFLYEIDEKIEGFGYERDPRIQEIRSQRNIKEDAPIVLDCKPEEIATNEREITENTKSYIGKLFPGIFSKNINQIFTSFPEGKIQKYETTIGGKTKEELKTELEEKKIYVSDYAKDLMDKITTSKNQENLNLIRLTVKDLGFPNGATTDEIYKRAQDFGLELCPAEVGPQLRLSYSGQDWMLIAMKQISDRDGHPGVFDLGHVGVELALYTYDADPSIRWRGSRKFVFSLRKS